MDLDLRYETAFAASPDILALWEESHKVWDGYSAAEYDRAKKTWDEAHRLWNKRYKFSFHLEAYRYWKATRKEQHHA